MTRPLLFLLTLSACDPAPTEETIELREAFVDQYPDEPFQFGCDFSSVNISELTPKGCAIMLTACMDSAIEWCDDAKVCIELQDACFEWIHSSCWSKV